MARLGGLGMAAVMVMALVAGLPAGAAAVDRGGGYSIIGYGSTPCVSLHQSNETAVGDWLGGYLTAVNQAYRDTYDIKGDLDLDGVMDWIFAYCSDHGSAAIGTAASAFFESHYAARRTSR